MTFFLRTEAELAKGLEEVLKLDPRLKPVFEAAGMPPLRKRAEGFAGLAAIVTGQQLSTASAAAIWTRVATAFDPFEPAALRKARPARLARLGLSAAKIKTLKAIAKAIDDGEIDFARIADMPADDAHTLLTSVHGIGPWTADLYLLFCLGHADAWPTGDLAVQEALRVAFGLETRPTAKQMQAYGEAWRPWRGVAAYLLWTYYRAIKRRDFVPVNPT